MSTPSNPIMRGVSGFLTGGITEAVRMGKNASKSGKVNEFFKPDKVFGGDFKPTVDATNEPMTPEPSPFEGARTRRNFSTILTSPYVRTTKPTTSKPTLGSADPSQTLG